MRILTVGAVREQAPAERRVALVPEAATMLRKDGIRVLVETGAGTGAWFGDADYTAAGADVVPADELYERAHAVLCVRPPNAVTAACLRPGQVLIGLLEPSRDRPLLAELTERGVRTLSLDLLPRTLTEPGPWTGSRHWQHVLRRRDGCGCRRDSPAAARPG
ncbi:hypothetical protein ACJWDR_01785 [Streptomyces tauricus]|uniref:hypothetical protein n=1 Tax=Streptomyces tauricus TaxID=68274 RepID=UPI00387EF1A5